MTLTHEPAGAAADGTPRDRIPTEVRTRSAERNGDGGDGRSSSEKVKREAHRWSRFIHVYTSMIALLIVLFFGLTGITLNHPQWTFGDEVDISTATGTLPFATTLADGSVDYLSISEFVRDEHGVHGSVDSFDTTSGEASIAYKNAGYAADVFVDVETGEYEVTIEQQGWVAVLNDLHKGRDTGDGWKWVIDVAAGFLVVISITGLVMQFFLRKRRRSALISVGVGALATIVLISLTLR
jgi:hypothetical protein